MFLVFVCFGGGVYHTTLLLPGTQQHPCRGVYLAEKM